jgi:hypothetical protein
MSPLGIFHTAVSVSAIGFGLFALVRDGRIDPRRGVGKLYLGAMLVASATALGIFASGAFSVGHALTVLTLALLAVGVLAGVGTWLGRAAKYVQTASLSASFFLLLVFAATETLTRLPVGQPIASSPESPVLLAVQLGLLAAFVTGLGYQLLRLRPRAAA